MTRLIPVLLLAGCAPEWLDAEPREVCDQVGYSIASRTMACEGDADLAIKRQQGIRSRFKCVAEDWPAPIEDYYHCPVTINQLPCSDVRDFGNDLDAWLTVSSACEFVLEAKK